MQLINERPLQTILPFEHCNRSLLAKMAKGLGRTKERAQGL